MAASTNGTSEADGAALQALYEDCREIYERARQEVTIPRSDGRRQKYAANRFMQLVNKAQSEDRLLDAITRVIERRTQGFGHLEAAGRPDLMLETYLLDETKPYHRLLPERVIQLARERMTEYWRRHPGSGVDRLSSRGRPDSTTMDRGASSA